MHLEIVRNKSDSKITKITAYNINDSIVKKRKKSIQHFNKNISNDCIIDIIELEENSLEKALYDLYEIRIKDFHNAVSDMEDKLDGLYDNIQYLKYYADETHNLYEGVVKDIYEYKKNIVEDIYKEKSEIALKRGCIKRYEFSKEFYKSNKKLCYEFKNLDDKIFEGCCDMHGGSIKMQENEVFKIELCELLDKFFDLGVKISNDWSGEKYTSKESYRDYIMNY